MKIQNSIVTLAVAVALGASTASLRADSPSAEDKALAVINSAASVGEKANACRELKLAGTEKAVPALAALLTDADLSHPARFALESMPCPVAGAALRDAWAKPRGWPARVLSTASASGAIRWRPRCSPRT